MWINRNELNNSLVVFIHGVFGSPWGSWKGIPELIQSKNDDPRVRSYDMYLFEYDTSLRRQPALDPYVVDGLKQFLQGCLDTYQTTVLIAHSQGGIVAKLYVLRMLSAGMGLDLSVDMIITLGTPHKGVLLAGLVPPPFLRQVRQLAPWSRNIKTLRASWGPPLVASTPATPTTHSRFIRSLAVFGAYDRLVGRDSAQGFGVDSPTSLMLSHPALAKPRSIPSALADLILQELRKHKHPQDILDRIRTIRATTAARNAYLDANAERIGELVSAARPELANRPFAAKVAGILDDFLLDFPRRPLRNLSFDTALMLYARRRLSPTL
jgi:pimeloyl-ACP methyl ester carboxylesterase